MIKIRNIATLLLILAITISMFPTSALASDVTYNDDTLVLEDVDTATVLTDENAAVTPLSMDNVQTMQSEDGGIEIRFDLTKEVVPEDGVSPLAIGWIEVVGFGRMRMRLSPDNGIGYFDWELSLTNGDLIKKVAGTLVCEKNDLLNTTNYAKKKVSESYIGTLYASARSTETFSFFEDNYKQNIKFKWSGFILTGVKDTYYLSNGSKSGKVIDFM